MRPIAVLVAVAVAALASAGAASADPTGWIGNTMIATAANGSADRVMLRADKTLKIILGERPAEEGTWSMKGNQYCVTSPTITPAFCQPDDAHKVGDKWTIMDPTGMPRSATLVAGQN